MVWKRVKRSGHQASKYCFNVSFKELIIDSERKPEKVQIAVMHRRRRYACECRPLEKSFSNDNRYMIVWPDLAADTISFNTTFFKDPNKEQFDNKVSFLLLQFLKILLKFQEWTLIAEEVTKKGKTRPLAAVQLNFAFFVNQNPDVKTELKLKLRCLQKEVKNCTLSLILSSTLVKEGHAMDDDIQSQASVSSVKVPIDITLAEEEDNEKITEGVKRITKDFEDWKEEKEVVVKPAPLPEIKQAWGEPPIAAANERRQSRNEEPPPPLPPHRQSTLRQSDSFEHDISPSISGRNQQPQQSQILPDRRPSIHSVIRNLPPPPPTPKKDEPLLDWCQRVTAGYKGFKIADFSRSWKSGLGFCAILHRYDPSLIGDFEALDFSGSKPGQKANCKLAFDAAKTIGVERSLDESEITTYPDEKRIISYLSTLRAALQGTEWVDNIDQRKSEYRISMVYGLSETEKNVMRDLERMRLLRDGDDETDRMQQQQPPSVKSPVEPIRRTSEGKVTSRFRMTAHSTTSVEEEKPKIIETNDIGSPKPLGRTRRDSIKELELHEAELQRMADEMEVLSKSIYQERQNLSSPKSPPPPPAPFEPKFNGTNELSEEEQSRRRKEEAKRLIEELNNTSGGEAVTISSMMNSQQRGRHQQQYNFYSVRSAQASPAFERKNYGHQRHGSDLSANAYPPTTFSTNPRNALPGMQPTSSSAFDRAKRYGSMRGAELAETLSQYIAPIMMDSSRSHQPYDNSLNATPTRKIITSFEKNVINVENINEELKKIAERIKEVENLDRHIEERIQSVEPGSEDEQKYLTEHMKLLNEKDALVRKQDYFNVAAEMSEVEEKLGIVQQKVNEVTTNNDTDKTEEEKQRIDDLVEEYKSLIDKKNDLAEILIQKEAEEEEHDESGRRTLERSQNFLRGSQEPLNTSRRIINWIKSTTS
jgi:hypothetical protein